LNDGWSVTPANAGTRRAISGSDSLSDAISRFRIGVDRYCCTAPSTETELSAVRSASFSTNTVSSLTAIPPDSALTASAGSEPRNDTWLISIE
jgi:hypothetical protein